MKMKRVLAVVVVLGIMGAVGCHSQIPPSSATVTLTITPPANSSGYTYVLSRITLPSGATTCPTPNVVTPNYTPLNPTAPISGTTYVDSTAGGLTACYIAQSVVGSSVSAPSNTAGPFAVPANLTAPTLGGGAVAEVTPRDGIITEAVVPVGLGGVVKPLAR